MGWDFDLIERLAVDSSGDFYAFGRTGSKNLPLKNPIQASYGGGGYDTFVAKFRPDGSDLVYSTYIGGSGTDFPSDMAIDGAGGVYILGFTESSTGFPLKNPFQSTVKGDWDFFICKINPDGLSLGFSTFLGGTGRDYQGDIKIPTPDTIIMVGSTDSVDFPIINPLQPVNAGGFDVFISMISTANWNLKYSSYFGGTGNDYGREIEEAGIGSFVLAGITDSYDFPVKNPFQAVKGGGEDAYAAKFSYSMNPIYLMQVQSAPVNWVPIQVSPSDINEYSWGYTPFTRSYELGTYVDLAAPEYFSGNLYFLYWIIDGSITYAPVIRLIMDSYHTVTAYYGEPSPDSPPVCQNPFVKRFRHLPKLLIMLIIKSFRKSRNPFSKGFLVVEDKSGGGFRPVPSY